MQFEYLVCSMASVLTLVASQKNLSEKIVLEICTLVKGEIFAWLNVNKAVDIRHEDEIDIAKLRSVCDALKIDFFITEENNRRKKLLLADMDSTIVAEETLDELAGHAGIKDQIAAITTRAMNGELDFHAALHERVGLLKDLSEDALHKTLEHTNLNPGAKIFVGTMKAYGATCVLVSGGFTFFTSAIARLTGFHHDHGNVLGVQNSKLTGLVLGDVLDKHAKVKNLDFYLQQLNLTAADALTIGDGANDLPMLLKAQEAGGLGIGYHAKDSVARELINNIRFGDLTAALYAQGYKDSEFN